MANVVRPVCCPACKERMYYAGDWRHEEEVEIRLTAKDDSGREEIVSHFYIHTRCWKPVLDKWDLILAEVLPESAKR